MRLRVHHPLFAGFLGIVGLLVGLLVLFAESGLRRELDATFRDEVRRELSLADAVLESAGDAGADSLARFIGTRTGYRVTIIDLDGVVLGDSSVEPERLGELENHRGRPEVEGVLGGSTVSFAERTSTTVGRPLLYGARMSTVQGAAVVLRIATPQTDIERAVRGVQRAVAVAGFFAMLAALAASYALSMAFTRPLVALSDRARRLAEGDFTSKVPRGRVAELQDLATAFNRLTEELQARLSELAHERDEMQTLIDCMAEGVVALTDDGRILRMNRAAKSLLDLPDVPRFAPLGTVIRHTELRRTLERSISHPEQSGEIDIDGRHLLTASRALDQGGAVTTLLDITELRHLEQVRRDFVANASHELKTPLTSIRGFAETLVDDDPPEATRRRFLTAIRNNTLRLQHLVDDLLDLSRLESGGWTAERDEVTVSEALSAAWDLVEAQAADDLDFALEGDAIVLADWQALVQVFKNLLENALRHTDPGGRVRVAVEADDRAGVVRISVADDGEGIPVRSLPRIFERFYRADSSRARDFGGTGLGLAIVKHFVGAMGGEIRAESELGKGTTIHFTLAPGEES